MKNHVFIATSLDGYIADIEEKLDWLPTSDVGDLGFEKFIESIDAIVMGKNTFNLVCSFGGNWPYSKPVFVASNSLKEIPHQLQSKATLIKGNPIDMLSDLNAKGYENLYIDGGVTISNFLKEDLIDEMTITIIPILLGAGISLFGKSEKRLNFKCIGSKVVNNIVQNHFKRNNIE